MDDLTSKIKNILSDEESLKQLSELAAMLGLSPDSPPPAASPGGDRGPTAQSAAQSADASGGTDAAKLVSLAGRLSSFSAEDDNIRFILALKPLLSERRRARADSAVRLLRLINLIPLIKSSGILGELSL